MSESLGGIINCFSFLGTHARHRKKPTYNTHYNLSVADLTSHFSPVWMSKEEQTLHKEGGPRSAFPQSSTVTLITTSIPLNRRWQYACTTRYWGQQRKIDGDGVIRGTATVSGGDPLIWVHFLWFFELTSRQSGCIFYWEMLVEKGLQDSLSRIKCKWYLTYCQV